MQTVVRMVATLYWLLSLLCGTADGQAVRVDTVRGCSSGFCQQGLGSGVIVGREGGRSYVLTAAHVVRDISSVTVQAQPAKVVAVLDTKQSDIALLSVDHDFGPDYVAVVGEDAEPGSAVTAHGFTDRSNTVKRYRLRVRDSSWTDGGIVPGISGAAITDNNIIRGIASSVTTDGRQTWYTPASICRPFLLRHCPPCVPRTSVPTPPVVTSDIPDREKTARIAYLEAKLKELERRYQLARGPQGERGPVGPAGPPGNDGKPGKDAAPVDNNRLAAIEKAANEPIRIRVIAVAPDGKETLVDEETYPRGTPIVLKMAEKLLMGE